ncbi:HAD-IA family hydrolase [Arthrobacter livingstonensis]|uniref:HAD-IA family hydrolase n=1 Tax=Arthrobacter livingstonensis TaxID=670078 RepID=UPI002482EF15|nr:HAD-IA family hydrolase [Arthrobacter livingstonensis]
MTGRWYRQVLAKPAAEIFDIALSRAGRSPQETLFIDDRDENLRAAEALGIQTHRFATAEGLSQVLRGIEHRTAAGASAVVLTSIDANP